MPFHIAGHPDYLADVLEALYRVYETDCGVEVRRIGKGFYFIDTPGLVGLLVDTKHGRVETSYDQALPKGFPGRNYLEHSYHVYCGRANSPDVSTRSFKADHSSLRSRHSRE